MHKRPDIEKRPADQVILIAFENLRRVVESVADQLPDSTDLEFLATRLDALEREFVASVESSRGLIVELITAETIAARLNCSRGELSRRLKRSGVAPCAFVNGIALYTPAALIRLQGSESPADRERPTSPSPYGPVVTRDDRQT